MNGEPIYQNPISTQVLLLLPPLLLLLGLFPTLVFMVNNPDQVNGVWFARSIIYSAFGLMAITCFPIILMYGGMDAFCKSYDRTTYIGVAIALLTGFAGLFDMKFAFFFTWCWACFAIYFLGIGMAYIPFHLHGFRPVWAKRRVRVASEQEVSFDDVT